MGFKGTLGKMMLGKNAQPSRPTPAAAPVAPVSSAPIAWDAGRFRIQIKLAKSRIEIQQGKKENEIDNQRHIVADHLRTNKEPLARIHAERLLRETTQIQAFDVIRTFLELLTNSHTVFSVQRDFDTAGSDIKESVASVVFASSRLNIPELHSICDMFRNHFGPAVIDPLIRIEGPHVKSINPTLARTLQGGSPDGYLVLQELTKIAADYNVVNWVPPPEFNDLEGRAPGDSSYYRPVPLHYPGGGPPNHPSAPPSDDYGGGAYVPMNIPGHNTIPGGGAPYGDIPGYEPVVPPGPPSAPPPGLPYMPPPGLPYLPPPGPFDPSANAPGTLYPSAPSVDPDSYDSHGLPPPPPHASFLNDDDLEARFRNVRGDK